MRASPGSTNPRAASQARYEPFPRGKPNSFERSLLSSRMSARPCSRIHDLVVVERHRSLGQRLSLAFLDSHGSTPKPGTQFSSHSPAHARPVALYTPTLPCMSGPSTTIRAAEVPMKATIRTSTCPPLRLTITPPPTGAVHVWQTAPPCRKGS